ncbi:MAG: putative DNA modification/repair radical SAM protein [Eubacteriales bacterium]
MKKDIMEKLKILSDAAKYDVSCSSSGVERRNNSTNSLGNSRAFGICHTWSSDGRCISLLKVLFTNKCIYDCIYCVNRCTSDVKRASFTPDEIAALTIEFYRRNYIEGLFLSSAIEHSPTYTMEKLYQVLFLLRKKYQYNGYIHVKAIPGADNELITNCGYLADRMSINIELPTKQSLQLLAPQKPYEKLLSSMKKIKNNLMVAEDDRRYFKSYKKFVPAGQSTQMIVGATPDTDLNILAASEALYDRYRMKRVYYSAYVPVHQNPLLPALTTIPPLLREHRLYQADWLLRFYNFKAKDIFIGGEESINTQFDPKMYWALNNINLFPIEINKAPFELLLKVPGIGHISAKRIIQERKVTALNYESLCKIGCVIKRTKYFVTCKGKYYGEALDKNTIIKSYLKEQSVQQMSFFDGIRT